ncbi:MAG: FkbM family methyltransferase [Acetobacteraceae bacterium]
MPDSTAAAASDPYWLAAAAALRAAGASGAAVLAPEGFAVYLGGTREYRPTEALAARADGKTGWIVVHKDHLAEIDAPGLAALLVDARLMFTNPVFGVFALAPAARRAEPDVASFIERLLRRSGKTTAAVAPSPGDSFAPRAGPVYLDDHTALTRDVFGHKLFVDTRDVSLTPHLLLDGYWEAEITAVLRERVRRGMVAVEVGTNCGYYSVLIADGIGAEGRYRGFDPNPRMCSLARRNLEINGFRQRAEVFNQAVTERTGRARFQVFAEHMGSSSLRDIGEEAAFWHDRVETIEVETVSLDEACAALPAIDFLKMDAEGAEPQVLAGARKLLERSPDLTMIVEFDPKNFPDRDAALAYLAQYRDLGFAFARVRPGGEVAAVDEETLLAESYSELVLARR